MSLVKRPVGFLGALVALILLSPVFLATIVLLFFANKGAGVFFTQDRPGKNEKIFKALCCQMHNDLLPLVSLCALPASMSCLS